MIHNINFDQQLITNNLSISSTNNLSIVNKLLSIKDI